MSATRPLVAMQGITKVYPTGVVANQDVDLEVLPGEIHALVGENGAGKSTLMKILYGLEQPTRGRILVDGRPVQLRSPRDAIRLGIGMVHQHFTLVPSLTVAENVVLGDEPRRGPLLDAEAAARETRALAQTYGLQVDPRARVRDISVGQRQRVEILKALRRGARLLILDEPTAVLTPQETTELFRALRQFVARGLTILFITHKLREVQAVADRVTVMRDGRRVATRPVAGITQEELARLMVGRDVVLRVEKAPARPGEVVLSVRDLRYVDPSGRPVLKGVSFEVRRGEIFGIAGVEGNGQSELVDVLTGLRRPSGGRVLLRGRDVTGLPPRALRRLGVGHIPEDRLARGVAAEASVAENLILDVFDRPPIARRGVLQPAEVRRFAAELVRRFAVRTPDVDVPVRYLSGGNMQKVVVARELARDPELIVAAQPTRGVDVGSIEFIHRELVRRRDAGAAVLLVSADLGEVLTLSDRVGVMFEGELVAVMDRPQDVSEEEIGLYMIGARRGVGS